MAEIVLFPVAQEIITKLVPQAIQQIGQWWGFRDEIEKLNRTVSTIEIVLLHAVEQSLESTQVKIWLRMLEEAIYDADDLLDDVSTEAFRRQVMTGNSMANEVRRLFLSSDQFGYGLKMSRKIKAIGNRLDEIAGNRRFHLEERSDVKAKGREQTHSSAKAKGREQTHSSAPEVVAWREHDKATFRQLLFSSNYDESVLVVLMVGMGGVGKTTLAQHVYNKERVRMHFEIRKWACISDDFDVKLISRNSEMEGLKLHWEEVFDGVG